MEDSKKKEIDETYEMLDAIRERAVADFILYYELLKGFGNFTEEQCIEIAIQMVPKPMSVAEMIVGDMLIDLDMDDIDGIWDI